MRPERLWPLALAGVLGVTVVANVVLIRLAADSNGAVVEPDYYRKAVAWDSTAAVARASATLGWTVDVQTEPVDARGDARILVRVHDRAGRVVTGARTHIEAISNVEATRPLGADMTAAGDAYVVTVPLRHGGWWEYRIGVTRGADVFVRSVRRDVAGPPGRG